MKNGNAEKDPSKARQDRSLRKTFSDLAINLRRELGWLTVAGKTPPHAQPDISERFGEVAGTVARVPLSRMDPETLLTAYDRLATDITLPPRVLRRFAGPMTRALRHALETPENGRIEKSHMITVELRVEEALAGRKFSPTVRALFEQGRDMLRESSQPAPKPAARYTTIRDERLTEYDIGSTMPVPESGKELTTGGTLRSAGASRPPVEVKLRRST